MEALEDKRVRLQPECKKRLNDRIEMWSYAAKVNMSRISFFIFFCIGFFCCKLFMKNFNCNEILVSEVLHFEFGPEKLKSGLVF